MAGPRIYVLPAKNAPKALVIRRGPTRWWHLLQWDLDKPSLQRGAWFHGLLYPRRCGLSPDGRLLGYFALKPTREKGWPEAYFGVSKAPWLRALAAWETVGTWTGGCHFDDRGHLTVECCLHPGPFHGKYPKRVTQKALSTDWTRRDIANELRRGWELWDREQDERFFELPLNGDPVAVLSVVHPGKLSIELVLVHNGTTFMRPAMEGAQLAYFLRDTGKAAVVPLRGVQWADWDAKGRLLVAGTNGFLEIRAWNGAAWETTWQADLNGMTPDPQPAPDWAQQW